MAGVFATHQSMRDLLYRKQKRICPDWDSNPVLHFSKHYVLAALVLCTNHQQLAHKAWKSGVLGSNLSQDKSLSVFAV